MFPNCFHLCSFVFIAFPLFSNCFPMVFQWIGWFPFVSHWFSIVFQCFPMHFIASPLFFQLFSPMVSNGCPSFCNGFLMAFIGFPLASNGPFMWVHSTRYGRQRVPTPPSRSLKPPPTATTTEGARWAGAVVGLVLRAAMRTQIGISNLPKIMTAGSGGERGSGGDRWVVYVWCVFVFVCGGWGAPGAEFEKQTKPNEINWKTKGMH